MPSIRSTDRPIFIAVGDPVVASFQMEAGGLTLTGLTLFSAEDENEFLLAVVGKGSTYNPLPAVGGWCEAGMIYGCGDDLVICRQSHNRTEHEPADIPALFAVYREEAGEALEWCVGEQVFIGTRRLFEGTLYECLQAHQTQSDWTPPQVLGTLWGVVSTTSEWAIGVAYTGDNTAGAGNGDVVIYVPNGHQYRCLQSHTSLVTWTPAVVPALWLDLGLA